jgi:trimeric autotransporter adhesin
MKIHSLVLLSLITPFGANAQYLATIAAGGGGLSAASNNVPATSVPLEIILGVAVDSTGNVYATANNVLLRISPTGVLTIAAGIPGNYAYSGPGDGGPATSAAFSSVTSVAVDLRGNLYVTDSNSIRKISLDGTINTIAGSANDPGFSGDGGPAIYARLYMPTGIAVDANGNVYFSDGFNCRIRKIDTSGSINTLAGNGQCAFSGDGGPATSAAVWPNGVAVDAAGIVYIADWANQRIRKIDAGGKISTIAGTGVAGALGDNGPAIAAQLNYPTGVTVDGTGNLYIADWSNQRIRKISLSGVITTVAGNGQSGYSGDGGPAINATMQNPQAVALDSGGNMYIAERAGRVRKVSPDGTISTFAGETASYYSDGSPAKSLQLPAYAYDVKAAPDGSFYVAAGLIFKVSSAGIFSAVTGGSGGFSGDGGPAINAGLALPTAIAVDSAGALYIADTDNSRVRKIDANGIINTVAGNGMPGFSGDGGAAAAAQLNDPQGVAVDGAGNLYIADSLNHRVRMVTPQGTITTVAGTGQPGFSGDSGPAVSAQLSDPSGLAVDSAGNLYMTDSTVHDQIVPVYTNQRIRKVDTNGVITTVAGNGQGSYSGDGGPATSAALCFPQGVTVDAAGNLFILDSGNDVVRKVDTTGTISTVYFVNGSGGGVKLNLSVSDYLKAGGGVSVDSSGNLYVADWLDDIVLRATPITTTDLISAENAASFTPTLSPGALLTLYGANLAASPSSPSAPLQASVGDTSVSINNLPTPLLYVSPTQINLQIPFNAPLGTDTLTVSRTSTGSAATQVTVAAASPAIFRLQNGPVLNQDQGAIADLDGSVASPFTGPIGGVPAVRGSYVSIYCTGLGDVTNRPANGAPAPPGAPYSETLVTPTVTIGGVPATVSFSGLAPNYVGLYQVNVQVPANAPAGTVPVTISIGNASDTVTMGTQ